MRGFRIKLRITLFVLFGLALQQLIHHNIGEVPCHRVIKSNGDIGKYVLGAQKKLELLRKEVNNL